MSQDQPTFALNKKFVSQDEIEDQKRKRQEEWEKVRKPDQPLEAPEEKYDPRSLYDRLQEQKQKKQDEYEAQFSLKNQVKGLEDGEVDFLDFVSDRQLEIEKQRKDEVEQVLSECRNVVTVKDSGDHKASQPSKSTVSKSQKSQSQLLAGALKRKSSATADTDEKKAKTEESESSVSSSETTESTPETPGADNTPTDNSSPRNAALVPSIQVVGVLPGLGNYSDSDLSSDSSTSEDEAPRKTVIVMGNKACNHHS